MPTGNLTLLEYRHRAAGFTLPLPDGWDLIEEMEGIAVVALGPRSGDGFQANVVVTIERLPPGTTLDAWVAAAVSQLPDHLAYYQLLDREPTRIAGRLGYRILSHHAAEGRIAVTLEQWLLVEGEVGYTISASVGTPEYDGFAGLFAAIAGAFRPDPGMAV